MKVIIFAVLYAQILKSGAAVVSPWLRSLMCFMKMVVSWTTPSGDDPVLNTLYDLFFRVICFANELWDILEKERQAESEKKKQAEARKEKLVDEFLAKRRFHDRINDQISRMKREGQFVPTAAIQRNTPLFRTDFLHLNSFFIFK